MVKAPSISTLTGRQRAALRLLDAHRGHGIDATAVAKALDTSRQGAAQTMSSLVRKGYADRFIGGVGYQRVHWQATEATPEENR